MSAPKFTPGPWSQVPQHGAGPMICREYETGNQTNPTGLRLVCHILQRRDSLEQDKANSRLIAAAPELYAQLEFAVKLLERLSGFAGTAQVESMRAALAKAAQS